MFGSNLTTLNDEAEQHAALIHTLNDKQLSDYQKKVENYLKQKKYFESQLNFDSFKIGKFSVCQNAFVRIPILVNPPQLGEFKYANEGDYVEKTLTKMGAFKELTPWSTRLKEINTAKQQYDEEQSSANHAKLNDALENADNLISICKEYGLKDKNKKLIHEIFEEELHAILKPKMTPHPNQKKPAEEKKPNKPNKLSKAQKQTDEVSTSTVKAGIIAINRSLDNAKVPSMNHVSHQSDIIATKATQWENKNYKPAKAAKTILSTQKTTPSPHLTKIESTPSCWAKLFCCASDNDKTSPTNNTREKLLPTSINRSN